MAELVRLGTGPAEHILSALEDIEHATLTALTSVIKMRDGETHGHSERVVAFSLRLGQVLGRSKAQMRSLELGALLHDIGKIGVPDAILRKPGKLTDQEWLKMREHPLLGREILRGISFLESATLVVVQHHEKWDGAGYPFGLRREEIELNARIFAVADAFDAMISSRVYHAGVTYEAAVAELDRCAGKHFDPAVIEAFHHVPEQEWENLSSGWSLYSFFERRRAPSRTVCAPRAGTAGASHLKRLH